MNNITIENINFELIEKILEFKKKESIINSGILNSNSYRDEYEKRNVKVLEINKLFESYSEDDIRCVHAFYYYGRDIISKELTTSFQDIINDFKNYNLTILRDKINGLQYIAIKKSWEKAKIGYLEHEENVQYEKSKDEKKQKRYSSPVDKQAFKLETGDPLNSKSQIFIEEFSKLKIKDTNNIDMAKKIIKNIINKTNGKVIVDFLGHENFDNLDFIENDDEVLKLYWKYSQGNKSFFNIRIDIAFDKLRLIQYGQRVGIILKGYYRSITDIKNYYNNKEKLKKIDLIYENEMEINETNEYYRSLFFYEIKFDKKQRKSLEKFAVTFLPWRYYNILIIPKKDAWSVSETSEILIFENLYDIEKQVIQTIFSFKKCESNDEDTITMFGNRFRKILEKLLKFIVLVSEIKFDNNYDADMLGKLLSQIKDEIKKGDTNRYNNYDYNVLEELIDKIEIKEVNGYTLVKKLNICSHYNVKHKISSDIIGEIYQELLDIVEFSFKYFKLIEND